MAGLSRARSRAPELTGRGWVDSAPVRLADLRGRVVLLDFFTSGCVNCRHVLREIDALEDRFGAALTVVGVHSPKFPHEAEPAALRSAVDRLGIRHPVLDDGDHHMLDQYAVRAWPTLVLVGPDGRIEATAAGEGHGPELAGLVEELLAAVPRGQLDVPAAREPPGPPDGGADGPVLLRHPQAAVRMPGGDLLVADAGHAAVTRLDPSGGRLRGRVGGLAGPGGLCVLPPQVADEVGYDVVVADTLGHRILGLRSSTGAWQHLAGTGRRRHPGEGPPRGAAAGEALASPEDVAWWPAAGSLVVALAGLHQLWALDLGRGTASVLAGTGGEQLRDGPAERALLAQPTALAAHPDGSLWWVDAESSAVRRLEGGVVSTVVGGGLFAFGHVDGPAPEGLLQHPQGLAVLPDGAVLVCDTYNGALRRVDAEAGLVTTVARGLGEPVGAVPAGDGGWLVVESARGRLTGVRL